MKRKTKDLIAWMIAGALVAGMVGFGFWIDAKWIQFAGSLGPEAPVTTCTCEGCGHE